MILKEKKKERKKENVEPMMVEHMSCPQQRKTCLSNVLMYSSKNSGL